MNFHMLASDVSRQRVPDLLREAEAERLVRTTRRARLADERGATRRFARAALAAVAWPIRH